MIRIRHGQERGRADYGWLLTQHTFSFAEYSDPAYMGFSSLRVINEDKIQPAQGFAVHPHQDMEILTYVLKGRLRHKDSMGNGSLVEAGQMQYMSAGRGVTHSEWNASETEKLHLLQIWILPAESAKGATPRYEQKDFSAATEAGKLTLAVSADGELGSIAIRQNVRVWIGRTAPRLGLEYALPLDRAAWVQVISGELSVNGLPLTAGDGASICELPQLTFESFQAPAHFLLFDLNYTPNE